MSTLSPRRGWHVSRRDQITCACEPKDPRHAASWQCVTPEQIEAWLKHDPDAVTLAESEYVTRQKFAWMWLYFDLHPVARQMSGRA